MGALLRMLIHLPITKSVFRFIVGLIAIPLFRLMLKNVTRERKLSAELEKDLEQWFRGALLLLVATANMEDALFGWVPVDLNDWFLLAMRIMLAVGVTEAMPDQELFRVIHPGPPKLKFTPGRLFAGLREQAGPFFKGLLCQHIDRSSQVFAIMSAILPGKVGWICYGLAVTQYLIIGLVTSKDKALDVLGEFDRKINERRRALLEELADEEDDRLEEADSLPERDRPDATLRERTDLARTARQPNLAAP